MVKQLQLIKEQVPLIEKTLKMEIWILHLLLAQKWKKAERFNIIKLCKQK